MRPRMYLFSPQHGSGTMSMNYRGMTHVFWWRGVTPRYLPDDFRELPSHQLIRFRELLRRNDGFDRLRMLDLLAASLPPGLALYQITDDMLSQWIDDHLLSRRLHVGWYKKPLGEIGLPKSVRLAKEQEERARSLGMPVPAHAKPVPHKEQTQPYAVYKGSGQDAMLDVYDNQADKPTCPNAYHRSEGLDSAKPEVRQWLDKHETRPAPAQEKLLGSHSKAGGGFLRGTTEVVTIPAGTPIWRYINEPDDPWGGWWFFYPYEGDPRVFGALPEVSSGRFLVKGRTKQEFRALCGPGAPRCTNKPGGPPQLCVPYSPAFPNKRESALITLVTT